VATEEAYTLAEGPFWDAPRKRLLWVDILGGNVHEGVLEGPRIRPTASHGFGERIGAVVPAVDGRLLVAAEHTLVVIQPDGRRRRDVLAQIIPDGVRRHLNDGGTDPAGRFLVGTLSWAGPSETEELVRLEPDGRITLIDDDLRLSNGLAWSADGRTMYSTDSKRTTIFARPYDPATGAVGTRRPHLTVEAGVDPDGCAIDAEEHLWVAIWGGSEVRRYGPDGKIVDRIAVPAPHTTSVAFAGDDLRTLVITTATLDLTEEEQRANPRSGHLFTARVDVAGLPVPAWSGAKRPNRFARRWRGTSKDPVNRSEP
jgi:sugar lactone lactonase YvrE